MNLEFGANLKKLRHEKDMTQDELAEKLALSAQAISRYETGTAYPDIEMLPVIAGFFGVTVDKLLGVSGEAKERRMDEYINELRKTTDRKERLAILRKQHAEFPDAWEVVSDMVHEMMFIPECLDEIREIVNDALKNCNDNLWRENIIMYYVKCEPDENTANAFIEKHATRYDMSTTHLLHERYYTRGDHDKLKRIRQKETVEELRAGLLRLTERIDGDIAMSCENCRHVLSLVDNISGNSDRTKPDMWIDIKLLIMLRHANNYFMIAKENEGFSILDEAITLFENFFALEDGTVLTYGSQKLDTLSATTEKEVYFGITEHTGMIAKSMMMNLNYQTPIGPVNEGATYGYDMEGFKRKMVFSDHTYENVLENASWDGFARVKDDPRYITLQERAKAVSSVENIDNLMFLMNSYRNSTNDYVKDKKWVCALLVKDVGTYMVFDDADDIKEKFARMQREGNTNVYRVVTVEIGGGYIETPEIIKQQLLKLHADNRNAQVLLPDAKGNVVFSAL